MIIALWACLLAAGPPQIRELDLVLPSTSMPGGIPVRLALPAEGRYGAEAPVVVHVAGGWGPGRLNALGVPLAPLGFIELRFRFPDDARGPASVQALAEVIAFAGGAAAGGRALPQLAAPLRPRLDQVGLVGLGNGGNSAVVALASHDRLTRAVAWLAMWETPSDDWAATGLTADADLSRLVYEPGLPLASGVRGGFYIETDRSPGFGAGDLTPVAQPAPPLAGVQRFVYSARLLREAAGRRLVEPWPRHLYTVEEATTYWSERLAAGHYLMAAFNHPDLLVMVLGGARDHALPDPQHRHLAAAYDGWLAARTRWLRLNPDAGYLAAGPDGAPETVANVPLSPRALASQLPELEGAALVAAGACELADRARAGELSVDLERRLSEAPPAR